MSYKHVTVRNNKQDKTGLLGIRTCHYVPTNKRVDTHVHVPQCNHKTLTIHSTHCIRDTGTHYTTMHVHGNEQCLQGYIQQSPAYPM